MHRIFKSRAVTWMKARVLTAVWIVTALALSPAAWAQERFWIQIEAQPSLVEAEERLRDYAASLSDVNGFTLGGGWYAIAIGPFDEITARDTLRTLRREGRVPRDSYLARAETYGQQFWPIGANTLADASPLAEVPATASQADTAIVDTPSEPAQAQTPPASAPQRIAEETPRQARASEANLSQAEREALQIALQWAGFYNAAIDGAFGRGTRGAMSAWQETNGFEPTGVLTTRQRAALLQQYNAVLDGVDLVRVADPTTGIDMLVPTGLVAFDAYEAPFARYTAKDGGKVALIQISRPGDQSNLFGLYDILQTLEIIPLDGPRTRRQDGFSITGENDNLISQTEVFLRGGEIKGYILVWPKGDEERRRRVLSELGASFRIIEGVLPLDAGAQDTQRLDLVSGMQVRQPLKGRSGVFVSASGDVLTAAEAVAGCGSLTLDGTYGAQVSDLDARLGVALLRPETRLAPSAIGTFSASTARLQSEVAVAGYSFEGALGAPTLTFGTVADIKGLRGENSLDRLELAALEGDVGGPVFDMTGAMVGVLQPRALAGRQLPDDVSFSTDATAITEWMRTAGMSPVLAQPTEKIAPEALTNQASAMTVLVTCWE